MRVSSLYLVAVLLVVSLPAALRGNQSSIVVHVIDCAGVSPTAMSVAEHTMVRAFAASGYACCGGKNARCKPATQR